VPVVASIGFVRWTITIGVIAILVLRWMRPKLKVDGTTLGLILLAAVPWLGVIIKSIKLPGGSEVVYQEIKEKQNEQEKELKRQQEQLKSQQDELASGCRIVYLARQWS
jgi:hypothetical protein